MNKILRILIIIFISCLLMGCLKHMSYGYYQLLRIACFVGFGYLTFYEFEEGNKNIGAFFALCTLLFNPIIKVSMSRNTWIFFDVGISIILIVIFICSIIQIIYTRYKKWKKAISYT